METGSNHTSKNAWLTIWHEPRQTLRSIVSTDVQRCFWVLSALYGVPLALNCIQNFAFSSWVPLWALLVGALVLSPFVGMIGISVAAWLLHSTGRWIGGKGSFLEVRAAVAWSNVPSVVTIGFWVLLLGLFGGQVLDRDFAQTSFIGYQAGILFLIMLMEMVISVWGFIILLYGLAEVQGFSVGRALCNLVIPFVGVIGCIWLLSWAIYS